MHLMTLDRHQKYVDMYPTDKIKIPKSFLKEHPLKEIGSGKGLKNAKLAPFPEPSMRSKSTVENTMPLSPTWIIKLEEFLST